MKRVLITLCVVLLFSGVSAVWAAGNSTFVLSCNADSSVYRVGESITATLDLSRADQTASEAEFYSVDANFYYQKQYFDFVEASSPFSNRLSDPATHNERYDGLRLYEFPFGGTLSLQLPQNLITVQLRAKLPAGVSAAVAFIDGFALLQSEFMQEVPYAAQSQRYLILSQSAWQTATLTPVFCDKQGNSVAGQIEFISGAGGYSPDEGYCDALTWGEDVCFSVTVEQDWQVESVSFAVEGNSCLVLPDQNGLYTVSAAMLSGNISAADLVVTAVPELEHKVFATDGADGAINYTPYSVYTGDMVLTLLSLPEGVNWRFAAEYELYPLLALSEGLYPGYNYCALIDWGNIAADDAAAQKAYLQSVLAVDNDPALLLSADDDVNCKKGSMILDIQMVADFCSTVELLYEPDAMQLLKADINRDGMVGYADVNILLERFVNDKYN